MYRATICFVLFAALTACEERGEIPTASDPGAGGITASVISSTGLVAYYPFEGDVADASGNGHHGAIHGGVGFAAGPRGIAATFGAGDHVRIADHDQLDTDAAMTVAAWVRPDAISSSGSIFLSKWFSSPIIGDWILRVHPASGGVGNLLANIADYDLDTSATIPGEIYSLTQSADPRIPIGVWSFVTMTFDGTTLRIYVNGTLVGQTTGPITTIEPDEYSTDDVFIGDFRGVSSSVYLFSGGIDEVRIYDRALSGSEVRSLYRDPQSAAECKDGGWATFGFRNQGQCIRFVQTGYDSREGGTPGGPDRACAAPPAGMVAWWPGDGTADDIVGPYDGILMNGAGFTAGMVGSAFSFDGIDDHVNVGTHATLEMTTEMTIDAWIYPTGTGGGGAAGGGGIIVNKEGEYEVARFGDGTIRWAFSDAWAWHDTGVVAPQDQWSHVAVVFDHGVVSTYLNGLLTNSQPSGAGDLSAFDAHPAEDELRIGGRQGLGGTQHFDGRIDEVGLFASAVTGDEIAAIAAAGPHGKCAPGA